MSSTWKTWPRTRWGWASLVLAGIVILFWASMPIVVQIREGLKLASAAGLAVVALLGFSTVLAIVLGWLSIGLKKDKSIVLFVVTCVVSGILLLAVLGEGIEAIMFANDISGN